MSSKGYTCLAHVTTTSNFEAMSGGSILTLYDRYRQRVNARGVYSYCDLEFDEPFQLFPGDFPGVYMSLVDNIDEFRQRCCKFKGTIILIFPLDLLQQSNWHFNLVDRCGSIGYDTYFPETFDKSPHVKDIIEYYGENINEVVFHHSVPMSNASHILTTDGIMIENASYCLQLNLELKRNCVFYSDRQYSGKPIKYYGMDVTTTSDEFYIDFIRQELPVGFKHLCDGAVTKEDLENALSKPDVFTFLHTRNQETEKFSHHTVNV